MRGIVNQVGHQLLGHGIALERRAGIDLAEQHQPVGDWHLHERAVAEQLITLNQRPRAPGRFHVGVAVDQLVRSPRKEILGLQPARHRMRGVLDERGAAGILRRFHLGGHALVAQGGFLRQHDHAPAAGSVGREPARRAAGGIERVRANDQHFTGRRQRFQAVHRGKRRAALLEERSDAARRVEHDHVLRGASRRRQNRNGFRVLEDFLTGGGERQRQFRFGARLDLRHHDGFIEFLVRAGGEPMLAAVTGDFLAVDGERPCECERVGEVRVVEHPEGARHFLAGAKCPVPLPAEHGARREINVRAGAVVITRAEPELPGAEAGPAIALLQDAHPHCRAAPRAGLAEECLVAAEV